MERLKIKGRADGSEILSAHKFCWGTATITEREPMFRVYYFKDGMKIQVGAEQTSESDARKILRRRERRGDVKCFLEEVER